jgi:hypothetical protein
MAQFFREKYKILSTGLFTIAASYSQPAIATKINTDGAFPRMRISGRGPTMDRPGADGG